MSMQHSSSQIAKANGRFIVAVTSRIKNSFEVDIANACATSSGFDIAYDVINLS